MNLYGVIVSSFERWFSMWDCMTENISFISRTGLFGDVISFTIEMNGLITNKACNTDSTWHVVPRFLVHMNLSETSRVHCGARTFLMIMPPLFSSFGTHGLGNSTVKGAIIWTSFCLDGFCISDSFSSGFHRISFW